MMNHPITEQIRRQLEEIEIKRQEIKEEKRWNPRRSVTGYSYLFAFNGVRKTDVPKEICQPVYVLDVDLNIIARIESKNLVREWIAKTFGKWVSDKTAYRYFTSGKLYKGQYYFVPVSEYESFVEKFQNPLK